MKKQRLNSFFCFHVNYIVASTKWPIRLMYLYEEPPFVTREADEYSENGIAEK